MCAFAEDVNFTDFSVFKYLGKYAWQGALFEDLLFWSSGSAFFEFAAFRYRNLYGEYIHGRTHIKPSLQSYLKENTMLPIIKISLFTLLLSLCAVPASAQSDSNDEGTLYYFDPGSIGTITGTVADFDSMLFYDGTETFTHLVLSVGEGEMILVALAPTYFLQSNNMLFTRGETVEVTGSMVGQGERTFIIATSVKKGDRELELRDQKGVPLWLEDYMKYHQ